MSAPTLFWRRAEFAVAALISGWVVTLHLTNLLRAGPLWRDEVGTVDFAAMPSVNEIWHNLRYDNFPPLFVAVARVWTWAGFKSDFGYRCLGFLVGMATLAAFWWCPRKIGARTPLICLALYAVNPVGIRVGDSLRPYGLGIVLTFVTMVLVWRFLQAPGWRTLLPAIVAAVLSVQSLYQNAFFIAAFCVGGWVVTYAGRDWKRAKQIGLIGLVAALSLLPYVGIIRLGDEWRAISRVVIGFDTVLRLARAALQTDGGWMDCVWLVFLGMVCLVASRKRDPRALYFGTVLFAGVSFHLLFLGLLNQPPRLWYFLSLMAPVALIFDALLISVSDPRWQMARVMGCAFVVLACASTCFWRVGWRQSNIDLVAAKLKESAKPDDFIIVNPWYFGVSLQRYLDTNRWTTLPPMEDVRIHRYDLLRRKMEQADAMVPILQKTETTLRAGQTVWVVGGIDQPGNHEAPPVLPPYRAGMNKTEGAYCANWASQEAHVLDLHAADVGTVAVPIPGDQPIGSFENVRLMVFQGWRE
jgi:hypothetical protein